MALLMHSIKLLRNPTLSFVNNEEKNTFQLILWGWHATDSKNQRHYIKPISIINTDLFYKIKKGTLFHPFFEDIKTVIHTKSNQG